ncbi:MAG TPA: alanine racemase, partial [Hyphomonadaceae bacterium]|nr:alanine racemase [Hyphomonadaceae bacterium]
MNDRELHAHLIGQQGGRKAFNTPVLVIELDALERNIAKMAAFAKDRGIALRPHAKTHKSADIAKKQVAAGSVGVCCAKLGEAEAMADGGIGAILVTSPVVSAPAIERLMKLNARIPDLRVALDNPANVAALNAAASAAGKVLQVLIDIDPGIRRTGVPSPEAAADVGNAIKAAKSLHYLGVQYYCGREQHIEDFAKRREAVEDRTAYLRTVIEALAGIGMAPGVVTGGGTGTHRIDAELGVFNELQVGSYVFMDRQYNECDLTGADAGTPPYETSLQIDARVVSANTAGLATIDAGFKAMATDGGPPTVLTGAPVGAPYHFMGDEHGLVVSGET